MVDINLGNKTLVVGVLVALILSYGMVNFDSRNQSSHFLPVAAASSVTGAATSQASETTQEISVARGHETARERHHREKME